MVDKQPHRIALGLLYLLPGKFIRVKDEDSLPKELALAVEFYEDDLPHPLILSSEYGMWIRKWKQQNRSELSNKLVDSLQACSVFAVSQLACLVSSSFDIFH